MFQAIFQFFAKLFFFTGAFKNNSNFPKPLSAEEERENFEKFHQGDQLARENLIKHNLRLCVHIAKKYNSMYENDDLISIGSIGLIKAINTFSYEKGTSFGTFASRCIENEILMVLRQKKKTKNTFGLLDTVGQDKDGNNLTMLDILTTNEEEVFFEVDSKMVGEKLCEIMKANLDEREFEIISYRYGLMGRPRLPQREVAKKLNISRSYISRIESYALSKLKNAINHDEFR